MTEVRAKKNLGQHFLKDKNIAANIVDALHGSAPRKVLEIGPGMGVLTQFLLKKEDYSTSVIEIDRESVEYLKLNYPELEDRIISGDFLRYDLNGFSTDHFSVIGNFPYNISSQIFFKVLENREKIDEVVCMIQKEVAERLAAGPGSKTYGILSVLLQAWYKIDYLFTVHENVFSPPPKVKSAVIRLERNDVATLGCDEKLFTQVIKAGFNQRRKTLRNSLKSIVPNSESIDAFFLANRPEQLSVDEFIELTKQVEIAKRAI
ncbi:MAG: 16S rRNA (adenine(1518)-N(6)/adenine(1519)-N(6))-dimethyltransferase RsmA [Bacteroidota bacterium]|nr:16S rRNA (adenine(1518)-N(6)/adenine(1519)-N(6))-dimethyltransferase RsmA [Bacteroidota bacterium]MDP4205276.1 16S rRNA (adenine(1518)-N(6)/adenine(1519)-N(6))-dimethyltransferase RsmA [Bacteroidota bacterium]